MATKRPADFQVEHFVSEMLEGMTANIAEGIDAGLEYLKAETLKVTPIDTGELRRSAFVISPGMRAGGKDQRATWKLAFNADHAGYVHEINRNYRVGHWKFLERTVQEQEAVFYQIVQTYARRDPVTGKFKIRSTDTF